MFNNEPICIIFVALLVIIIINNFNCSRNEEESFNIIDNKKIETLEKKTEACKDYELEIEKTKNEVQNYLNKQKEFNNQDNEVIKINNIINPIKEDLQRLKKEYTDAEEKLLASINKTNQLGTTAEKADELANSFEKDLAEKIRLAAEQAAKQHATEALLFNKTTEELELKKAKEIKWNDFAFLSTNSALNLRSSQIYNLFE